MSQTKLLIDTNSYLRLARSLHPLLSTEFGSAQYCLYCIPELNAELQSRRLKNAFAWAQDPMYVANRLRFPTVSKVEKKAIQATFDFIRQYAFANNLSPSSVDILVLAYAQELAIPAVTDDKPMRDLAKSFGIKVMTTLDLLKLMVVEKHIDMAKVREIASYWMATGDWPGQFSADYKKNFREPPP